MAEIKNEVALEIAHVLFLDIVAYSKMATDDQRAAIEKLNRIVQSADEYQKAERERHLLKLATGDGMALIFYQSPEDPVECALEISRAVKEQYPELRLRMGVHSGPVGGVVDVNGRANVAGAGINTAQRVMECGDAGHILLSKRVAEDLRQFKHWRPHLYQLGECEVKHGEKIEIVNLFTAELGNPEKPKRLSQPVTKDETHARKRLAFSPKLIGAIAAALALIALLVAGSLLWQRQKPKPSAIGSAIPEKSIAVLPFDNLSEEKANAFFTDGVQDEILTNLARVADLKVISRTSVMQYKTGVQRNLRKIAEELGVAHVVEGSVQRAANRVRVNAQLIDARRDAHLWAQTYDRDLVDVFAIQSEIAKTIADQLQAKLSPREVAAIEKKPTQDTDAYDLYLRGKELINNTVLGDASALPNFSQAVKLLEQAVARDPNFAVAYDLLVEANLSLHWRSESNPDARDHARRALEAARRLAPEAGETYLAEALFSYWGERDYERALELMEKAILAFPNSASAFGLMARIKRRLGRWTEATRHAAKAVDLDPKSWFLRSGLIGQLLVVRDYTKADQLADRAITDFPDKADHFRGLKAESALKRGDFKSAQATLATLSAPDAWQLWQTAFMERNYKEATRLLDDWVQRGHEVDKTIFTTDYLGALTARAAGQTELAQKKFAATRQHYESLLRDPNEQPFFLSFLAVVDAALGRKEEALQEARRAAELRPLERDPVDGPKIHENVALAYSWIGDRDRAIQELSAVTKLPPGPTCAELKFDPRWDELRDDPRFEQLVASLAPKN